MGCDIHIVLEHRAPSSGEWVGVYCTDFYPVKKALEIAHRDYAFFAEVAGVRGHTKTTVYQRNLPVDVSRLAWLQYMRSPTDHHSPSHMTVRAFLDAYERSGPPPDYRKEWAEFDVFGIDSDDAGEYRVVFWFDN